MWTQHTNVLHQWPLLLGKYFPSMGKNSIYMHLYFPDDMLDGFVTYLTANLVTAWTNINPTSYYHHCGLKVYAFSGVNKFAYKIQNAWKGWMSWCDGGVSHKSFPTEVYVIPVWSNHPLCNRECWSWEGNEWSMEANEAIAANLKQYNTYIL